MAGVRHPGSTVLQRTLAVFLSLATLTACGIQAAPSPSLSGYSLVRAEALVLAESLDSLEWDFHVAVQRKDETEAQTKAHVAVSLIEAFLDGPLQTQTDRCLGETQTAVGELLDRHLAQWRAWSEGRDYPDRDQISLFYAFYGADKPWKLLIDEAEDRCQKTA